MSDFPALFAQRITVTFPQFMVICGAFILVLVGIGGWLMASAIRGWIGLAQAGAALRQNKISEALSTYRALAAAHFNTLGEFKVWGGQQPIFDGALHGIDACLKQAGRPLNLEPLWQVRRELLAFKHATKNNGYSEEDAAKSKAYSERFAKLLNLVPKL